MKIGGNEIRPGNVILHEDVLWVVVKTQHTQPGKGGAYMQAELKELRGGRKKNERFRAAESVERIFLEDRELQYLYSEGTMCTFMDPETFEQVTVSQDLLSVPAAYLQDGMMVTVGFYEGGPISATLPAHVVLTVEEADPVVKGQTATSSFKHAVLSNGIKTMVPPHIEAGTRIIVNTEDGSYVERSKT